MTTTVINLFGGPGVGKSTWMHRIMGELKLTGLDVEAAPEYAKELVWQEDTQSLADQIHIFGEQQHRLRRLLGQVDVVVTDAPLLNSIVYDRVHDLVDCKPAFHELVYTTYQQMRNLNILLKRDPSLYQENGREQTSEEAQAVDALLGEIMTEYGIGHTPLNMTATIDKMMSVLSLHLPDYTSS